MLLIGQLFFIAVYGHLRMLLQQWIVWMLSIQTIFPQKGGYSTPLFQPDGEWTYFENCQYWIYHVLIFSIIFFVSVLFFPSFRSFSQTLDICKNTFDEYVNDIKLNETIFWINVIDTCLQIKLFATGLTTEKCPF